MIATLTPTTTAHTDTQTIEFISPTALRCHCQEYRVNHFCLHLVYYMVAKIQAFRAQQYSAQAKEEMHYGK